MINPADTISRRDVTFDDWTSDDTALLSIRQNPHTMERFKPVYDGHRAEYPKSEPDDRSIFCEYHSDLDEVVYWLDLDDDVCDVTDVIGNPRIDGFVKAEVLASM